MQQIEVRFSHRTCYFSWSEHNSESFRLIHIGTSGWSYAHWEGILYAPGLLPRERLRAYASRYRTAEPNASYYRWPRDSAFASWRRRLPDGFVLSVKAPRGLTHQRRLYAPERWTTRIAASLGRLGDRRVAVELRHPSWHHDALFELLERHGAAYCVMSGARLPCVLRATSRVVYVRMHGPSDDHLYAGSYPEDDLRWWSDRILEWAEQGRDVFVYLNNDGEGNAVRNADRLRELLGV